MKYNQQYFCLINIISSTLFIIFFTQHIALRSIAPQKGKDQKNNIPIKNKTKKDAPPKKTTPVKANQINTTKNPAQQTSKKQKSSSPKKNTPSQNKSSDAAINIPQDVFSDAEVQTILQQTTITDEPVNTIINANNDTIQPLSLANNDNDNNNNDEILVIGELTSITGLATLLLFSGKNKIKIKAWKSETERKENVTEALKELFTKIEEKVNKSKKKDQPPIKLKIDEKIINEFITHLNLPPTSKKDIVITQTFNKDKNKENVEFSYVDENNKTITTTIDVKDLSPEVKSIIADIPQKDIKSQEVENNQNENKKNKDQDQYVQGEGPQEHPNPLSLSAVISEVKPQDNLFNKELEEIKKKQNNEGKEAEDKIENSENSNNNAAIISFNKDDNTKNIQKSNSVAKKKNIIHINVSESEDGKSHGIAIQNFNYADAIKNNNIYKFGKDIPQEELKNIQKIFNQKNAPLRTILEKLPHINSNVYIGADGTVTCTLIKNPEEQELPQNKKNDNNNNLTIEYNINPEVQEKEGIKILVGTNEKPILTLANNEQLEKQIDGKPQAPKHIEEAADDNKEKDPLLVKDYNENMKVLNDALNGLRKEDKRTKEETSKQYKELKTKALLQKPFLNTNKKVDDFNLNNEKKKSLLGEYIQKEQFKQKNMQEWKNNQIKQKQAVNISKNILTGNLNINGLDIGLQNAINEVNNQLLKKQQITQTSDPYAKVKFIKNEEIINSTYQNSLREEEMP